MLQPAVKQETRFSSENPSSVGSYRVSYILNQFLLDTEIQQGYIKEQISFHNK